MSPSEESSFFLKDGYLSEIELYSYARANCGVSASRPLPRYGPRRLASWGSETRRFAAVHFGTRATTLAAAEMPKKLSTV